MATSQFFPDVPPEPYQLQNHNFLKCKFGQKNIVNRSFKKFQVRKVRVDTLRYDTSKECLCSARSKKVFKVDSSK